MKNEKSTLEAGNVESSVLERYSAASEKREEALCCPIQYDPTLLKIIPQEVIEKDYGCGDPTRHIHEGETVLDLGSGGGKACFIATQVVGSTGRVIGVDFNDDMLALSRKHRPEVAKRVGHDNIEIYKGKLQDLRLDRDRVDAYLSENPVDSEKSYQKFEAFLQDLKDKTPMIPDGTIDVVISNCVLNLVNPEEKAKLFTEIHRVLKEGGRAVISDIVSDEIVPAHLQADPELWSGCISGAFEETQFIREFEEAGFWGVTVAERDKTPWQTIEGIEFRSMTLIACKGRTGPCLEHKQAVMYKGPFNTVMDDDGHVLPRGKKVAVCGRTFEMYSQEPYRDHLELLSPREPVAPETAEPFPCTDEVLLRDPRELKGEDYGLTSDPANSERCSPDSGCC